MNINQLKAMLELKAVQNFGTNSSTSNQSSTFQDILSEILTDAEMNALTQPIGSDSLSPSVNGANSSAANTLTSITTTAMPPLSLIQNSGNFDDLIKQASQVYHIPSNLIKAVIQQESSFNPNAVSQAGAGGLMQLMPETARSLGVSDVFNPEQNIMAGSKYLKQLLDHYDGNTELALAAYNAGSANVAKYNGIPPFSETENYVKNIMNRVNS